jgi:hypothetical protein
VRRRDWGLVAVAFAAAVIAFVVVTAIRFGHASRACGNLGPLDAFPQNSVSYVRCVPAFVVSDSYRHIAVYYGYLSSSGRNVPLAWDEREQLFTAGGRSFVIDGREYIDGSAHGPSVLTRCPTKESDGRLFIVSPEGTSPSAAATACRSGV